VVTAGVLVAVLSGPREPEYGGRRLSEWVLRLNPVGSAAAKEAEEAIRHIGTNALPYLLKWIQEKPPWEIKLWQVTEMLLRRNDLGGGERFDRAEEASEAFRALGPQARGAVPKLIQLMKDLNRPWNAKRAERAIMQMGTNAWPELPAFVSLLTGTNDPTEDFLISVVAQPQLVIPALTNCLQSSNDAVRFSAARALARFGRKAQSAVPALLNALGDSNAAVGGMASIALHQIDPKALEDARNRVVGKSAE